MLHKGKKRFLKKKINENSQLQVKHFTGANGKRAWMHSSHFGPSKGDLIHPLNFKTDPRRLPLFSLDFKPFFSFCSNVFCILIFFLIKKGKIRLREKRKSLCSGDDKIEIFVKVSVKPCDRIRVATPKVYRVGVSSERLRCKIDFARNISENLREFR